MFALPCLHVCHNVSVASFQNQTRILEQLPSKRCACFTSALETSVIDFGCTCCHVFRASVVFENIGFTFSTACIPTKWATQQISVISCGTYSRTLRSQQFSCFACPYWGGRKREVATIRCPHLGLQILDCHPKNESHVRRASTRPAWPACSRLSPHGGRGPPLPF